MSGSFTKWSLCALLATGACSDAASPKVGDAGIRFTVVPLWPDTVGICLGAGSPSGTYTFSWIIQFPQPGDILQDVSPTTRDMNPGECLLPWRRATPLPGGVFEDIIVTEVAAPPGVRLDSVEVQDRYGDHVYASATDTAQVDTLSGAALTFYHHRGLRRRHRHQP